jgi:transcriptional regulator with XRE-family HTH domain
MGNRIFYIRTSKNIKQSEMGQRMGIVQSAYSKLERGSQEMTIAQIYQIAEILEVPVFWLLDPDYKETLTDAEALEMENFKKYLIEKRKK